MPMRTLFWFLSVFLAVTISGNLSTSLAQDWPMWRFDAQTFGGLATASGKAASAWQQHFPRGNRHGTIRSIST